MSRKKKTGKSKRQRRAGLHTLSASELWDNGSRALEQEKYQQAIQSFKTLLKEEKRPEALAALEQAYAGRIRELGAKSMFKEALALLETMRQRCPNADAGPLRLILLLQSGSIAEAAVLFQHCRDSLTPEQVSKLEVLFGAFLLAGVGLRPEDFDNDSPVALHHPAARQAMDLFLAAEDRELGEALKKIPFRSPYRDLRTLLAGLLKIEQDHEAAGALLKRIEPDSPYYTSAIFYLAAGDTPETILATLRATSKADLPLLRERYNLDRRQSAMLEDLAAAGEQPLKLHALVRRHSSCFNPAQRLQLFKNILPFCGINTLDLLPRHQEFDTREKFRITALAAEKDGVFGEAVEYWREYLAALGDLTPSGPYSKETALVLRRQAKMMDQFMNCRETLETLLKSLEYDPDHTATWLKAANYAKLHFSRSQYYAILNQAVAQLPENPSILVEAMKASGQRGAHKKAAGLAERVLAIDPINTGALDFLAESRLEHARKLASRQKWDLAEKELLSLDRRVKAVRFRGRGPICLGMLQLLRGKDSGLEEIARGCAENGFAVLSRVLVLLEARLYNLAAKWPKHFGRELRQTASPPRLIDKVEFLRLMGWLNGFTGRQWLILKESCRNLSDYFKRAASLDWSREEGLAICTALDRAGQGNALVSFTDKLIKTLPDDPQLMAWQLIATHEHKGRRKATKKASIPDDLFDKLEDAGQYDLLDRLMAIFVGPDDLDSFLDDLFAPGLFGLPKKAGRKKKPQPKPPPFGGRQLNLFDEE